MKKKMSDSKQVAYLLEELCVRLGFCLPPAVNRRLEGNPPEDVDEFTDLVFREEGLDPHAPSNRRLRRQVLECVAKYFDKWRQNSGDDQPDGTMTK
jgi:hypothetical protein